MRPFLNAPRHHALQSRSVHDWGGGFVVVKAILKSVAPSHCASLEVAGSNVFKGHVNVAAMFDFEPLLDRWWRRAMGPDVGDVDDAFVVADDGEVLLHGRHPVHDVGASQRMRAIARRARDELVSSEGLARLGRDDELARRLSQGGGDDSIRDGDSSNRRRRGLTVGCALKPSDGRAIAASAGVTRPREGRRHNRRARQHWREADGGVVAVPRGDRVVTHHTSRPVD
jgi:hypothetical protein